MGPFWRKDSPRTENGGSIVRSPTPGLPIFVEGWVRDIEGQPVEGPEVDIWHTSAEGFYENQDPAQADMNLRGKLLTDARGYIAFRSVKPAGYPIPIGGPVGDLLRVQGRHNMRPAHIRFMIHKQGYRPQFSQIYSSDGPNLESDVQFGVTRALVGQYVLHSAAEPLPLRISSARGTPCRTISSSNAETKRCRRRQSPARPMAQDRCFKSWVIGQAERDGTVALRPECERVLVEIPFRTVCARSVANRREPRVEPTR